MGFEPRPKEAEKASHASVCMKKISGTCLTLLKCTYSYNLSPTLKSSSVKAGTLSGALSLEPGRKPATLDTLSYRTSFFCWLPVHFSVMKYF